MNSKKKKRMIALDADFLIFEVTEGGNTKCNYFGAEDGNANGSAYKEPLKQYKKKLKQLIKDIEDEVAANLPGEVKGIKPYFSDPKGNFRYDIYPAYKANRKGSERSELFYRLRSWAHKKFTVVDGVEADDVVAYYVSQKGWIGATLDKDLLKGVPGRWFDVYYSRRCLVDTSPGEALHFNFLQCLMGDPVDNIKGIPGVGEATAIKLLDKHGWTWDGVYKAYIDKGLGEEEMTLNARLVLMTQWHPKKGVKLWKRKG